MNRHINKLIITIISTLMLSIGGTAVAQSPDGDLNDRGDREQRGPHGNPFLEKAMRGIKSLDLSAEQRVNIRSILQTLKADSVSLMEERRATHMQLRTLITAETYDAHAVALLANTAGQLAAERVILSSQALAEVYSQLTAEQQTELDAKAADRMTKRAESAITTQERFQPST